MSERLLDLHFFTEDWWAVLSSLHAIGLPGEQLVSMCAVVGQTPTLLSWSCLLFCCCCFRLACLFQRQCPVQQLRQPPATNTHATHQARQQPRCSSSRCRCTWRRSAAAAGHGRRSCRQRSAVRQASSCSSRWATSRACRTHRQHVWQHSSRCCCRAQHNCAVPRCQCWRCWRQVFIWSGARYWWLRSSRRVWQRWQAWVQQRPAFVTCRSTTSSKQAGAWAAQGEAATRQGTPHGRQEKRSCPAGFRVQCGRRKGGSRTQHKPQADAEHATEDQLPCTGQQARLRGARPGRPGGGGASRHRYVTAVWGMG